MREIWFIWIITRIVLRAFGLRGPLKLMSKYFDPFRVLQRIGWVVYKLQKLALVQNFNVFSRQSSENEMTIGSESCSHPDIAISVILGRVKEINSITSYVMLVKSFIFSAGHHRYHMNRRSDQRTTERIRSKLYNHRSVFFKLCLRGAVLPPLGQRERVLRRHQYTAMIVPSDGTQWQEGDKL